MTLLRPPSNSDVSKLPALMVKMNPTELLWSISSTDILFVAKRPAHIEEQKTKYKNFQIWKFDVTRQKAISLKIHWSHDWTFFQLRVFKYWKHFGFGRNRDHNPVLDRSYLILIQEIFTTSPVHTDVRLVIVEVLVTASAFARCPSYWNLINRHRHCTRDCFEVKRNFLPSGLGLETPSCKSNPLIIRPSSSSAGRLYRYKLWWTWMKL